LLAGTADDGMRRTFTLHLSISFLEKGLIMHIHLKNKDRRRGKADGGVTLYLSFLILLIFSGCFLIYKGGDIRDTYSLLALPSIVMVIGLSVRFIVRVRTDRRWEKLGGGEAKLMMRDRPRNKEKRRDLLDAGFTLCFIAVSLIATGYLLYTAGLDAEPGSSAIFQCAVYLLITSIGLSITFIYRIYVSWNRRKSPS
jgi:hypothetical protein